MPRKKVAARKEAEPDYRYHSSLATKFINAIMEQG